MGQAVPSGEQIELRAGDQRVVVVEVGAGLRSYTVGDRDVLDGYREDAMAGSGRGQMLMPWPNRIDGGSYEFDGARHQLPINDHGDGNAIHGLVRWAGWSVRARAASSVTLEHRLHPRPGYPFSLALTIEYALSDAGLRVTTGATNVGPGRCPFGSGAHPYLTIGTATVDEVVLCAPGATVIHTDARGIPTGTAPVDGTEYDFRQPRPIGGTQLDHAFGDLQRGDDGRARVELRDVHGTTSVALWLDQSHRYVQLFTGDPLPDVSRRSLAVEPMTCPPNAFRSGEAVLVLEPGETTSGSWGIEPITTALLATAAHPGEERAFPSPETTASRPPDRGSGIAADERGNEP